MASTKSCIARMSRLSISPAIIRRSQPSPFVCLPCQQLRHASDNAAKYKRKDTPKTQKKKKTRSTFKEPDLSNAEQFSLCDAMRYIRAFEVGRPPTSAKYEMHIKLRTLKNGPVVRNRLRLPHPVKTDLRICVICPPDSAAADAARKAGASLVGEDNVFEAVKEGKVDFDRCICHVDSLQKLNKAGLGRILGPKGLMPSAKMGTVVKDVATTVRDMVGGAEYRERMGVVRMAIGQLGFSPEEMQRNIKAFVGEVRKDIAQLSDRIAKDVHEVVLSSTNAPGFSLNGDFRGPDSVPTKDLSTL
ncbi:hypothetical protein H2201_005192 [Coniosporium apollinis]|uniref:50S ribosomal protein L1 n=1 Tax=Coniosporium apollinis TaxID=61459 RepID=A0ABQ9NQM2_9PEZI|nr:hypothetical protein H2201_005192 [Coniosporium apollinis]